MTVFSEEELLEHYRSLYGECGFQDDYHYDVYERYVESYGVDTIDEFLDHMKFIAGDDTHDSAFYDLSNCFELALIDKTDEVNLDELECDYFICGDYTFNPYWEED